MATPNLVPAQVNLTNSSGNSFSITQDSADQDVHLSALDSAAVVYLSQKLSVSSVGGIIASAGDVKSKDYSLNTLGSTVSTFSSDISTLQTQVSNLISVINTAFGLSLS
jgi:hypothetical protein